MKVLNYIGKYKWSYYSNTEIKELYKNHRYIVLGELTKKEGPHHDMPLYDVDGNAIYVQPIGTYKKPIYKSDGYLWSEEAEGFIIVKKSNWATIIGSSILSILLIIGLVFGMNYFFGKSNIDPNAKTFTSDIKRSEDMDKSRILVPGYNDWNMLAGTDEAYIALYNPDQNPCYFQFSVILDETQEVLFETGLIPPGQAVTTVKLPRVFEEGVYPITININSYSLDDESQKLNGGEVNTNIVAIKE